MSPTDPNEAAVETWIETTDGFDRVEAVLERTREPTTAAAIAEQAHVSEATARKHLSRLVELGAGQETIEGNATRYQRNDDHALARRVQEVQERHTREELIEAIAEMREELDRYRTRYDVDSPDDLVVELSQPVPDADSLDIDDEPWDVVGDWRATQANLAVARTALSFKRARDLASA